MFSLYERSTISYRLQCDVEKSSREEVWQSLAKFVSEKPLKRPALSIATMILSILLFVGSLFCGFWGFAFMKDGNNIEGVFGVNLLSLGLFIPIFIMSCVEVAR